MLLGKHNYNFSYLCPLVLIGKTYVKTFSENAVPSECNGIGLFWREKVRRAGFQSGENIVFSKKVVLFFFQNYLLPDF